jgi:hypothetical protein
MSCHPCAGHMATCDHCYLCDVVGVCCMTAPATSQPAASPPDELTILREAIAEDGRSRSNLTDLIQSDAIRQVLDRPSPAVPTRFERRNASAPDGQSAIEPRQQPALPPASAPDPIFHTQPTERKDHAHNHPRRRR